ncbi:50S ribosomal protein L25 [Wansuia hejianensis]|uniref:Large ribosomal subunit protein bL25 n=1 Tax=Wansuia hejianensis TaxID=2763667 RepID=A0A926F1K7_9FIRM|nr:50S ribosomal protein L25 [Wansuia hejianensis]MBC8590245.1 50S ribosomal protein L25 [Wansuia hejianensis]
MASLKMKTENRIGVGSNEVKKLRADSFIPGVIYKRGEETKHVQVKESEFLKVFREAGTTTIIDLELEGKTHPVIVKDVQEHPVKNKYLHVDFQELNMDEKLKVLIPINLINRDSIKLQPSVLTQLLNEVEVECLPGNIPNTADVDVADMDFTTPIFVKDLDIASDEDITILADLEEVVCTLTEPSLEEDLDDEGLEDVDVEVPLVSEEEEEE